MDAKMFKIGALVGFLSTMLIMIYLYLNFDKIFQEVTAQKIDLKDLDVRNLMEEKVSLETGKPKIINFWATWCIPCLEEFPYFESIHTKYKDKIDVLMLSDESASKIDNFIKNNNYSVPILRNTKDFGAYGIQVRPSTYFYNAKGEQIKSITGSITEEKLETEITKLY